MLYKSTREDRHRAYLIAVIYVVLAGLLGIMLFKVWPPIPWPTPEHKEKGLLSALIADTGCPVPSPTPAAVQSTSTTENAPNAVERNRVEATTQPTQAAQTAPTTPAVSQTQTERSSEESTPTKSGTNGAVITDRSGEIIAIPIRLFGQQCINTTFDERLLLLVIIAGMLGAFVHCGTSLADYIGNNRFNKTWTWFYLLRPPIGMALALVFYFVIRGGFLTTTGGAKDINPYGIAALAGLVGMFSKQATDKLSEVFGTLFRSAPGEGDARRADPLTAKHSDTRIQLDPESVIAGGEAFDLVVTGAGFADGAAININGKPAPTTFEDATTLVAEIPKEIITKAGALKITVLNPDQTQFGPVDLVVTGSNGDGTEADGESGDKE